MKRKKYLPPLPDAINCEVQQRYTQVPIDFLRNPKITSKAKVVLSLLLGNKEGWKSFVIALSQFMKEGEETVRTAVKELEKLGYVLRLNYRDKKSKQWRGWLWVYTNVPYKYNIQQSLILLDLHGLEIPNLQKRLRQNISPEPTFPEVGNPNLGFLRTNKINNNKINTTTTSEVVDINKASNGYITKKDFFKFVEIYPKERIGSKGEAMTKWDTLCNDKIHRPTWKRIERAIQKQKQTPRWQNPKFIPLARTWIFQKRWLDDPSQMVNFENDEPTIEDQRREKASNESEWARKFGYDKDEEDD